MTTRERLFDAARELYAQGGPGELSMRVLGRRAGVSAMAVYRHFPDKDALVGALMEDGFAAWEAIVRGIEAPEPVDWLRRVFEAYRAFALSDPHRFDAAFLLRPPEGRAFPAMTQGRKAVVAVMKARIEQARPTGELSPLEIALSLSATAQGLVSMQRAGRFPGDEAFTEAYRRTLDHALAGFLSS